MIRLPIATSLFSAHPSGFEGLLLALSVVARPVVLALRAARLFDTPCLTPQRRMRRQSAARAAEGPTAASRRYPMHVEHRAGAEPTSTWLADAARRKLRAQGLERVVREWEAEHGALLATELRAAERKRRAARRK